MRYNVLTAPLRLELTFSKQLAWVLMVLYLSASLFIWLSQLHWLLQSFIWGVVSLSVIDEYRRHLYFYQRPQLQSLVLSKHGIITDGNNQSYTIANSSRLWPWFILLDLRAIDKQVQTVVIFPDSLTAEDYRRLRLRLYRPAT